MTKLSIVIFSYITLFTLQVLARSHCKDIFKTGTPKTLVRFYNSKDRRGEFEKQQVKIWKELETYFFDFLELTLIEHDCHRCPDQCYNFHNTSLPSYTIIYDDLPMSTCVRPATFKKARNYVFDYLPRYYKKSKNFTIATTHCDVIYPDLRGTEIFEDDFDKSISKGLSYVLFVSRWCHYCKQFYPLWNRLKKVYSDTTIKFYTVDCVSAKEFCATKNAVGFPTLVLYNDGKFVNEYSGTENMKKLIEFTDKYWDEYKEKSEESYESSEN